MNKSFLVKIICCLLLISVLSSLFIACTTDGNNNETTAAEATSDTEEVEERMWIDSLPDKNFNGATFNALCEAIPWEKPDVEYIKEVVSQADYERYCNIEERFNVTINRISSSFDSVDKVAQELMLRVSSGDTGIDMAEGIVSKLAPLAMSGYVLDLNKMEEFNAYIDLEQPYWSEDYVNALNIGNCLFWLYGCTDDRVITDCIVYLFNKQITGEVLGDPDILYDYVNNKEWTLDKVNEIVKDSYKDDGNGERDVNDRYGIQLRSDNYLDPMALCADADYTKRDEENIPYSTLDSERNISINEKLYDLYNSNGYMSPHTLSLEFGNGNLLLNYTLLGFAQNYRDVKWDFGVLPSALFDENQEEYLTTMRNEALITGLPVNLQEDRFELSCYMLEAYAAEGYRLYRPAQLDWAFKNKYSRDEQTKEMLDLCVAHVTSDFIVLYGENTDLDTFFYHNIEVGNRDISSMIARRTKPTNKCIEKLVDQFQDTSDNQF